MRRNSKYRYWPNARRAGDNANAPSDGANSPKFKVFRYESRRNFAISTLARSSISSSTAVNKGSSTCSR